MEEKKNVTRTDVMMLYRGMIEKSVNAKRNKVIDEIGDVLVGLLYNTLLTTPIESLNYEGNKFYICFEKTIDPADIQKRVVYISYWFNDKPADLKPIETIDCERLEKIFIESLSRYAREISDFINDTYGFCSTNDSEIGDICIYVIDLDKENERFESFYKEYKKETTEQWGKIAKDQKENSVKDFTPAPSQQSFQRFLAVHEKMKD